MARKSPGARTSRAQESRESMGGRDSDIISFEEVGPLPDIPARPGFAQRWIRVRKGNEDDRRNRSRALTRGWHPRAPNTVPKAYQALLVQHESLGGCVGMDDTVLMERPSELNAREAEVKRRERRERERAVKNTLFSEFKSLGGTGTGLTAPDDAGSSSRVERGRAPAIQDD